MVANRVITPYESDMLRIISHTLTFCNFCYMLLRPPVSRDAFTFSNFWSSLLRATVLPPGVSYGLDCWADGNFRADSTWQNERFSPCGYGKIWKESGPQKKIRMRELITSHVRSWNFWWKKSGKPWVVQIAGIGWKVWNGWNRIPPWDDDFNRDWLHWSNIL